MTRLATIILLLVAVSAVAGLVLQRRFSQAARQAQDLHAAALAERISDLQADARALRAERAEGQARLTAASNRAARAEAAYEEERATHEPLRRQIEKMVAADIGAAGTIERQAAWIEELRRAVEERAREADGLRSERRSLTDRVSALEAREKEWAAAEIDLNSKREEARRARVQLEAECKRLQTDLDAARKEIERLNAETAP